MNMRFSTSVSAKIEVGNAGTTIFLPAKAEKPADMRTASNKALMVALRNVMRIGYQFPLNVATRPRTCGRISAPLATQTVCWDLPS